MVGTVSLFVFKVVVVVVMIASSLSSSAIDDGGDGGQKCGSSSWFASALQMPRRPSTTSKHFKQEKKQPPSNNNQGPTSYYSQGLNTYQVPMDLYEMNRSRLYCSLIEKILQQQQQQQQQQDHHVNGYEEDDDDDSSSRITGIILLQGGKQTTRYDTDHEPLFRQESFFHWCFGVDDLEGCYGTICLQSGNVTLFVPQYSIEYEIFCGPSPNLEEAKKKYGIRNVLSVDELPNYVDQQLTQHHHHHQQQQQHTNDEHDDEDPPSSLPPPQAKLYLLSGLNTDSGNMAVPAYYDGIDKHADQTNLSALLYDCIVDCRVHKTQAEIDLMKYSHYISSMAHVEVMKSCQPGMMEYQLESLFQYNTYTYGGARHMSYTCICACGPNPSILHYGHAGRPNNRQLVDGDMALLDMGVEYHCYASDITCSFPVNGKFTNDQRIIYQTVLDAQIAVIQAIRPGVVWTDMHRLAERVILEGLIKAGILYDDDYTIGDMVDADIGALFLPCGLGHFIGLDTHDVGGYAPGTPSRSDRPGLKKLRTARTLQEGMVITVEPGIYFIDVLLDIALKNPKQSKFINVNRLQDFRGSGGVRLEDSVVVTKDGCENLTTCPRSVEEVLDVMNNENAQWPPKVDSLPELRRNWVKIEDGKIIRIQIDTAEVSQKIEMD